MIELHIITLVFSGTGIFILGWFGCFAVSWLFLDKTGKESKHIVPVKDSTKRSNPQNVPFEKLEGKRLLSIQEAEALRKRRNGLPESDPELFIWNIPHQQFLPDVFGACTDIYTYATTRPEGYYEHI